MQTTLGSEQKTTITALSERAAFYALDAALRSRAEIVLVDWPSFDVRGVIEGYYGNPATGSERISTLQLMAGLRQNVYVYGPKDDKYARGNWADPYPPALAKDLSEAASYARSRLIDFVWSISPGAGSGPNTRDRSIKYSSDADFVRLTSKIESVRVFGIERFALFLDDTAAALVWAEDIKRFSSVAQADAYLINRLQEYLLARDPKARLLTVTPVYSGQVPGWADFSKTLGALLRKDVDVFWTGPKIFSTWSIKAADLEGINLALGRKVTIWDNSPPWPGSLIGRGPDLPPVTNGFLSNNMLGQGGYPISAFWRAMGPIADYTWNASAYDPSASLQRWRSLGH